MASNFPNLKETDIKIQETQRAPNKQACTKTYYNKNGKKLKRILKATGEKLSINYKGTPIRLSADFPTETTIGQKIGQDIFKVLRKICSLEHSTQ